MPSFLFVAAEERFYPALSRTFQPGDTYEGDGNPDPPHFDEVGADGALNPTPDAPVDPPADAPTEEA